VQNLVKWAVLLAALSQAPSHAGEVIAHPSVDLSADEIRDVFLGEKQLAGNLRLVPVDNSALRPEFLSKVLQTDERKYAARWTRKSFREGLVAPVVKGSDAEVRAFVKATPGAIGYISGRSDGLKVLQRF
jgi:ABC-type phosphate transport system substrate-binding protein